MTYRLSSRARDGLRRTIEQVERNFGARAASRVLDRLSSSFEALARHPELGRRRPELTDDPAIRFHVVGRSLVAYRW